VLIDRIWPRGVTREEAPLDERARDLVLAEILRRAQALAMTAVERLARFSPRGRRGAVI
jgi:uncharacterized protein YeaO (DUF488 family)